MGTAFIMGLAMGKVSGLVAIDIDRRHDGERLGNFAPAKVAVIRGVP
jgi:hypothetical protein